MEGVMDFFDREEAASPAFVRDMLSEIFSEGQREQWPEPNLRTKVQQRPARALSQAFGFA